MMTDYSRKNRLQNIFSAKRKRNIANFILPLDVKVIKIYDKKIEQKSRH